MNESAERPDPDPFSEHAVWITLTRREWLVFLAALSPRADEHSTVLRNYIHRMMSPEDVNRPEHLISLSMSANDLQALATASAAYIQHLMKSPS
jgi:hypothetical protein